MDATPPLVYSQSWAPAGSRVPLPLVGGEREILSAYLDWHRETFRLKCAGLTREQLSHAAVPPSTLSLHGLVRHLAGTERWSFRMQFAEQADLPHLYYSDDDPDQDFTDLDGDPAEAFEVWEAECARSREIAAAAPLDATGTHIPTGEPVSLRRILVHMLAEYARHNGHADLLRERLDGAIGH